jgi:flagella basal body P-ring formation protein FlgA
LRLAPCERIEPYLPPGTRLWGRTRVGPALSRRAPTPWNVFVPVHGQGVRQALVRRVPLAAGAAIMDGDLRAEEVDLADRDRRR